MSDLEREKKPPINRGSETGGLHFYYKREERLKKLRTQIEARKQRRPFFIKKRGRGLFILLANVVLIYLIIFFYMKPSNVYLRQEMGGVDFELNVTALRGKKTLIGFTVKNEKGANLTFQEPVPVSLNIKDKAGKVLSYKKFVERGTVLLPRESTSVIFILEESTLPRTARLEVFYGESMDPLFRRDIRF